MKAKLVSVTYTTRVLVADDSTEEQIIDAAKLKLNKQNSFRSEFDENVEKIVDDEECPFGTFETDKVFN